jgi:hypothetical protein
MHSFIYFNLINSYPLFFQLVTKIFIFINNLFSNKIISNYDIMVIMISINDVYDYFFQLPNRTTAEENKKDFITEDCCSCREIRASFQTHDSRAGKLPRRPAGIFDVLRSIPWSCLGPRKIVQGKINQIQQQSAAKAKKALIIEANGRWNDFPLLTDIPKIRRLAQTHSIEYYPISSREDYFSMLKKLPSDRLYDYLWIRGHGNPAGVFLGKLHFGLRHMNHYKTVHFPYHIRILAEKIRKGGKVIFESCNVGSGKINCAKSFSRLCPDATVYASKTLHHAIWGLTMRKDGTPHFKSLFGFTSTRIYQKGRKVSSPINYDGANRQSKGPLPEAQADARGPYPRTAPTSLPPL